MVFGPWMPSQFPPEFTEARAVNWMASEVLVTAMFWVEVWLDPGWKESEISLDPTRNSGLLLTWSVTAIITWFPLTFWGVSVTAPE
jgi:hypothetical protein